jgi:copper-containing nitrite reductase
MSPMPVEKAVLTFAPDVPPPITRRYPATVRVDLVTDSAIAPLNNEYRYEFWRFNGHCPGPFIRVRVGDTLELKLTNLDKTLAEHNIDFHAVMGPGGGSNVTNVGYGDFKTAKFKMLHPGLFIYHCAAAPLPLHIANGMYGLILVEPEEGLPQVDREYYVLQSEFYLEQPESRDERVADVSFPQGLKEDADAVVFNGREGSLTGSNMLRANVGERVRIFFGNAGPNLISSFHVIGAIFEKAYRDGDLISPPARSVQTMMTAPGSACVVEVVPMVPGNYTLVDHSIFRTEKGAVGFLSVLGENDESIYSSPRPPQACVGCKLHQ